MVETSVVSSNMDSLKGNLSSISRQESSQNIHNKILSQHGRDVLELYRKAEKTGTNISSWKNHRMFNLRCLHNNVIPTSVKLVSNVNGDKADQILCKAEKRLLQIRISQCSYTLKKLRIEHENLTSELTTKTNNDTSLTLLQAGCFPKGCMAGGVNLPPPL